MASVFSPKPHSVAPVPARDQVARWDLRLFGTFRVLGPDGSVATPNGRKARALLAYVALADGETVSRERLAALLWSERGEDQARASLRQTLYDMRGLTSGAAPPLALDRTGVRSTTGRMVCDHLRIRIAAESGDVASLASLLGERPPVLLADLGSLDPASTSGSTASACVTAPSGDDWCWPPASAR